MSELENIIYKYYPRNVSYFSGDYEKTEEYKLLKDVINQEVINWESFTDHCGLAFKNISIEDKTTSGEPGFILLFYLHLQGGHYIFVLYLSKIIEKFCYRVEVIKGNPNTYIYPDFKNRLEKNWNKSPEKINDIANGILNLVLLYFPQYSLFTESMEKVVSDVSTFCHDLGEATIFNIFFSNHIY